MSLSKLTVSRIINVVRNDKVSAERINSLMRFIQLPGLTNKRGIVRNLGMALGQGLLDRGAQYSEGKYGVSLGKGWNPFDPNAPGSVGYELQCTGIADAACAAIMRAKAQLPALQDASLKSRTEGFAHAGVGIETTDGGSYVIDWWLTLDVDNPYLFHFADWDNAKGDKGIRYGDFRGFP